MPEERVASRLVAATLAAALMPLNSTMIAVALPAISVELDADPSVVAQALVTSYLVAAIVLQSPAGKIGDRIGHSRMVGVGQLLVAAGALLGYLAPSLALLTTARVLMAAGGAVLVPATVALLRRSLPEHLRGRAFGAFGAVMALAAAVGPLVGGALVDAFGWASVFVANLPVLALSVVLGAVAGRTPTSEVRGAPPRFDWTGSLLLGVALTCLVLGLRPGGGQALLVVAGAGLLVPFVLWEQRVRDPVVALVLFRSVTFSAGTVLIAVQNLVMYALLFEVPLITEDLFDLGARATGQLLVSLMLAMVIVSPVGGRLVDRVGPRVVALAGSAAALVGIIALAVVDLTAARQVVVPLALLGAGLGLATPAAQSASITAVSADHAGMAAGVGSTMRYLGGLVGVAVMSVLLDVSGTRSTVVSEHRTLMLVFAGVLLVGLACAALLPGRPVVSQPRAADAQRGV
ncbi:MAG TPA: MFS transporter [Marmoricola sp.]|nr:MFS transporter [Marmoricola sp.]